jgi:hypothetical protein
MSQTSEARGRRRGQVRFLIRPKSSTMRLDDESHRAASATSEVTSLQFNLRSNNSRWPRRRRVQQSQPQTTNVAENHNHDDVLQEANLFIRGSPRDHFFNCAIAGTFSQAFETAPCQIKLA